MVTLVSEDSIQKHRRTEGVRVTGGHVLCDSIAETGICARSRPDCLAKNTLAAGSCPHASITAPNGRLRAEIVIDFAIGIVTVEDRATQRHVVRGLTTEIRLWVVGLDFLGD